jgi:general secretion pathway protein A
MYAEFYSFNSMPFQLTPDSRFFFDSAEHKKALAFLNYGISQGEGFVVITGEVGAGKTTLIDHLISTLDRNRYVTGRVVTTQLNHYDMLRMVGAAFDLFREGMDKATLIVRIKQMLSDLHHNQKRAILIIDESQSLPTEAIEELRMLSNLAVGGVAPLQSILLGQPEFRAVLARPELRQMRQRVTASCHLGALTAADTRRYIEHRLSRAGWKADPVFTDGAFDAIYRYTEGVPRRVNTLCSRVLLLGFLESRHDIDEQMVKSVGEELAAELGQLHEIPLEPAPAPAPVAAPASLARAANSNASNGNGQHREVENHEMRELREALVPRIARIEETMEKHERMIKRALDITIEHLGAFKA